MRGAFVQFMQTFLVPLPNVIIFQFNPETMTHNWSPAQSSGSTANPLAVKGTPGESFSFSLAMDSNDMIADGSPVAEGIATASGIYTRLAALEMLLYPSGGTSGMLGTLSASISLGGASIGAAASGGAKPKMSPAQLPVVLFVWGPGRILPVKVMSLAITEKLYDPILLNPTHADATIGLTVLTPEELKKVSGPLSDVARVAYLYSQGLRQAAAVANLANSAESVIGMLPV
jgi:hypothetical protein